MINMIDLLNQKRTNLDGIQYNLFDSANRQEDMQYMVECLQLYCDAVVEIYPNLDKQKIQEHIITTFSRINSIRVDQTDARVFPMKLIIDEFTHNGKIPFQDKIHDGVTMSHKKDGILILMPDFKAEMIDNAKNGTNKTTGRQTFVHEFMHASSVWEFTDVQGKIEYRTGLWFNGERGIFDDLNEGINEYFTEKVIAKMYPNSAPQPRYGCRVEAISRIMSGLSQEEQAKIFENYITGNSVEVLKYLAEFKNEQGQNLLQYIDSEFQQQGKRISSANSPEDDATKDELLKNISQFKRPQLQEQSTTSPTSQKPQTPCI